MPGRECTPKESEGEHDNIMDGLLDEMLLCGGSEDFAIFAASFPQPLEGENQSGMFDYS
jgi:hypothetical protein